MTCRAYSLSHLEKLSLRFVCFDDKNHRENMGKIMRNEKVCCNPFNMHSRRRGDNMIAIGNSLRQRCFYVLKDCGNYLCSTCYRKCNKMFENYNTNQSELLENNQQINAHQEFLKENFVEDSLKVNDLEEISSNTSHENENFVQEESMNESFQEDQRIRKERIVVELNKLLEEMEIAPINYSLDTSIPGRTESKINLLAETLKNYLVDKHGNTVMSKIKKYR